VTGVVSAAPATIQFRGSCKSLMAICSFRPAQDRSFPEKTRTSGKALAIYYHQASSEVFREFRITVPFQADSPSKCCFLLPMF
jgi:hypothetical protein